MKNFDSLRNIFGGGIRKHVLLRLFCLGGRHDRDKCRRKSSGLHESIIFFNEFQYHNERNGTSKDLIAKEVA